VGVTGTKRTVRTPCLYRRNRGATTFGALQSDVDGGTVAFRGIAYARPPVGGLRFTPPRATES